MTREDWKELYELAYDRYSFDFFVYKAEKLLASSSAASEPCGNCNGTGRMVRDPDIGTDQECFACDGSGKFESTASVSERIKAPIGEVEMSETGHRCVRWLTPEPPDEGTPLYTVALLRNPDNSQDWGKGLPDTDSEFEPDNSQAVCKICDGGPGNNCACTCGFKAYDDNSQAVALSAEALASIKAIAEWAITDPNNQDAINMQLLARAALSTPASKEPK